MICKLTKGKSTHNNTGWEYRGYAPHPPVVGESFILYYGTPTDSKFLRTTPVKSVLVSEKWDSYCIQTENSTYYVDLINPSEVYPYVEKTGTESRQDEVGERQETEEANKASL